MRLLDHIRHQYLVGQSYWSYIKGVNEVKLDPINLDFLKYEQEASRVMYCLATCAHHHKLSYIESGDPKTSFKECQKNLCGKNYDEKASFPARVEQHMP